MSLLILVAGWIAGVTMDPLTDSPKALTITSSDFTEGSPIPREYTCQGENVSPPITIGNVPAGAKALALIMDDPDAPRGTFLHWTFWNLPIERASLAKDADLEGFGAHEGQNGAGRTGYTGPCPPSGDHRYFFKAYALSEPLALARGADLANFTKAMEGKVLAWGELMGRYQKS